MIRFHLLLHLTSMTTSVDEFDILFVLFLFQSNIEVNDLDSLFPFCCPMSMNDVAEIIGKKCRHGRLKLICEMPSSRFRSLLFLISPQR